MDYNFVYKIQEFDSNEDYFMKKLMGTNLIPKIYEIKDCETETNYGKRKTKLIKMEKYDDTLYNYLDTETDRNKIVLSLKQIIEKLLILNFNYRIRHGDFHGENIVFKRVNSNVEWAFIDFEFSVEYDQRNEIIAKNYKISNESILEYDPYYDLLFMDNWFYHDKYYIDILGINDEYSEQYLSAQGNFELEDIKEIKRIRQNKTKITFEITPGLEVKFIGITERESEEQTEGFEIDFERKTELSEQLEKEIDGIEHFDSQDYLINKFIEYERNNNLNSAYEVANFMIDKGLSLIIPSGITSNIELAKNFSPEETNIETKKSQTEIYNDPNLTSPTICNLRKQYNKLLFGRRLITRYTLESYAKLLDVENYQNMSEEQLIDGIEEKAPCDWINRVLNWSKTYPNISSLNIYVTDPMIEILSKIRDNKILDSKDKQLVRNINQAIYDSPKPKQQFKVLRGIRESEGNYKIGDIITYNTPKSGSFHTSSVLSGYIGEPDDKDVFCCILEIYVPINAILSYHTSEDQVIFPTGAQIIIVSDRIAKDYKIGNDDDKIYTYSAIYVDSPKDPQIIGVSSILPSQNYNKYLQMYNSNLPFPYK